MIFSGVFLDLKHEAPGGGIRQAFTIHAATLVH